MRSKAQENIFVELDAKEGSPDWIKDSYPRTVEMRDYVADAFKRLLEAGEFGVHKRKIDPDALARFEQLGIGYRFFSESKRGDKGWDKNWIRLVLPHWMTAQIVAGVAA